MKENVYKIREFETTKLAQKYKTPLFVMDLKKIKDNYKRYEKSISKEYSNSMICYAYKANTLLKICNFLKNLGAGAELVSYGELYIAQKIGLDPKKMIFNGVNKTEEEITKCADLGVYMSVADSIDEINFSEDILNKEDKNLNLGIRVNPEINTNTHKFIATGEKDTKFGIDYNDALDAFEIANEKDHFNLRGIHFHIGSQIESLDPFDIALDKMLDLYSKIEDRGIKLDTFDVGGGLGVKKGDNKVPKIEEYTSLVTQKVKDRGIDAKLVFEPGRRLVNNSGYAILSVGVTKKRWIMTDGGANLFIRPAYLNWYHKMIVANRLNEDPKKTYNIAGPLCFSGDIIAKNRKLPKVRRGDIILVKNCGAYTLAMADNYNSRLKPNVIAIDDKVELIKEEERYDDLIRHEVNWNG